MTQYKVEMRDVDRRSWNDVGQFLMRMMIMMIGVIRRMMRVISVKPMMKNIMM